MTLTLLHYIHCPYCVRVRMTLSLLGIEYHSLVVPYDDEKTPTDLIGKKMLPIMKFGEVAIPESLDIMKRLDEKNSLRISETLREKDFNDFETLLNQVGSLVHSLAMPFWVWTPEFNESSRQYFQKKKEAKRGPFQELVKNQAKFKAELLPILEKIESQLHPFFGSESFTVKDILLSAHLWGLYSVPEFQFPEKVHSYLQSVKSHCRFNYQQPFLELI